MTSRIPVIANRIVVRGRVQGVGFRWFVRETARRESVAGWVRNVSDGSVEMVARGDPAAMERFIAAVRVGPPGARVDEIALEDAEVDTSLPYPFAVHK